jgi:hypothetical protein
MRDADLATILNTSITQTLGRTFLTSLTTFLAIIALAVLASGDIKNFAVIMIAGIIEGTYSTIFIASPIVLEWTRAADRRRRSRDLRLYGHMPHAPAGAGAGAAPGAAPTAVPTAPAPTAVGAGEAEGEYAEEAGAALPAADETPADAPVAGAVPSAHGPVTYTRVQPSRHKKKRRH